MKRKNRKIYIVMLTALIIWGMSGCTLSISIGKRPDTSNQEKADTEKNDSDEKIEDVQPSEKAKEIKEKSGEQHVNNENEGHKLIKNISADLNVREYPRHKSDLVAVVSDGQLMYFYGEVGQGYGSDEVIHDWYKIYLENGIAGWVRSDLVTEVDSDSDVVQ